MRDLHAIGTKIVQVLHPSADNAVLRDWDLWGPLIVSKLNSSGTVYRPELTYLHSLSLSQFCLSLAVLLSLNGTSSATAPCDRGPRHASPSC